MCPIDGAERERRIASARLIWKSAIKNPMLREQTGQSDLGIDFDDDRPAVHVSVQVR
jgi:hypothetical protein